MLPLEENDFNVPMSVYSSLLVLTQATLLGHVSQQHNGLSSVFLGKIKISEYFLWS